MAVRTIDRASLTKGIELGTGAHTKLRIGGPLRLVRLTGMFFDTDKCFLLPSAMEGIRGIRGVYNDHPASNLLIVGHTDTSGQDAYNTKLSLERADSVAAFLTDNVAAWDALFEPAISAEKRWGLREIQLMLMVVSDGVDPFFTGEATGHDSVETQAAVRSFQARNSLDVDGVAGSQTRKALIARYMATDGTSLPARNPVTGAGIEVTTHGCGEHFPLGSVPEDAEAADDPDQPPAAPEDGVHKAADRRVELFFFDGPITPVPPGKTSARESTEYPAWRRQVIDTIDLTVAELSPGGSCHISFLLHSDVDGSPLANLPFRVEIVAGSPMSGVTDGDGGIQIDGVEPGDYPLVVSGITLRIPAINKRESKRPIRARPDQAEV